MGRRHSAQLPLARGAIKSIARFNAHSLHLPSVTRSSHRSWFKVRITTGGGRRYQAPGPQSVERPLSWRCLAGFTVTGVSTVSTSTRDRYFMMLAGCVRPRRVRLQSSGSVPAAVIVRVRTQRPRSHLHQRLHHVSSRLLRRARDAVRCCSRPGTPLQQQPQFLSAAERGADCLRGGDWRTASSSPTYRQTSR